VRALEVKGQSILLRKWTLRPDVVESVHHQNITKRGSRANCQRWGALVCIDHFQVFAKITHTPGIPSLGDFNPDRSGDHVPLGESHATLWLIVSSGETLWLVWVFGFPVNALTFYKLTKLHQFIVFVFQFEGAWCIVWVSLPVATGLAVRETWKSMVMPRSIWLPNNCRKAFAHFGQGWLMWLKIAMKIENFHVST